MNASDDNLSLSYVIGHYVPQVEKRMEMLIPSEPHFIYDMIREYVFRGGKRIRPITTILLYNTLVNNSGTDVPPNLLTSTAIIELFHNFTLIHDDIEDNSDVRRGKPTLHKIKSVASAINTGDALYTLVWKGLCELNESAQRKMLISSTMQQAFQRVVEGQGTELEWYDSHIYEISEQDYYAMVRGKTGALFGCCCAVASIFANMENQAVQFYRLGEELGVIFQIQDDILNIDGDPTKFTKTIGEDISEGKRTLLTIGAMKNMDEQKKKRLLEILAMNTKDKALIQEAIDLIKNHGGVEFARMKAEAHKTEINKRIDQLPDNKWKETFKELVNFLINRYK